MQMMFLLVSPGNGDSPGAAEDGSLVKDGDQFTKKKFADLNCSSVRYSSARSGVCGRACPFYALF